ncbi:hypothetical protein V8E53_000915 [Lactarius tabidus]
MPGASRQEITTNNVLRKPSDDVLRVCHSSAPQELNSSHYSDCLTHEIEEVLEPTAVKTSCKLLMVATIGSKPIGIFPSKMERTRKMRGMGREVEKERKKEMRAIVPKIASLPVLQFNVAVNSAISVADGLETWRKEDREGFRSVDPRADRLCPSITTSDGEGGSGTILILGCTDVRRMRSEYGQSK